MDEFQEKFRLSELNGPARYNERMGRASTYWTAALSCLKAQMDVAMAQNRFFPACNERSWGGSNDDDCSLKNLGIWHHVQVRVTMMSRKNKNRRINSLFQMKKKGRRVKDLSEKEVHKDERPSRVCNKWIPYGCGQDWSKIGHHSAAVVVVVKLPKCGSNDLLTGPSASGDKSGEGIFYFYFSYVTSISFTSSSALLGVNGKSLRWNWTVQVEDFPWIWQFANSI